VGPRRITVGSLRGGTKKTEITRPLESLSVWQRRPVTRLGGKQKPENGVWEDGQAKVVKLAKKAGNEWVIPKLCVQNTGGGIIFQRKFTGESCGVRQEGVTAQKKKKKTTPGGATANAKPKQKKGQQPYKIQDKYRRGPSQKETGPSKTKTKAFEV